MSSPLAALRRNQRTLMAIFGVLIMLTFVVAPFMVDYQRADARAGRGVSAEDTLVTWSRGKLTYGDVGALQRQRQLTVAFLSTLVQKTMQEKKGTPKAAGLYRDQAGRLHPGIPANYDEREVARMWIMSQEAEALGLQVTPETIKEFLRQLCDDQYDEGEWLAMLKESTGGRMVPEHLFGHLRTELLAQKALGLTLSGLMPVTPAAAFNQYLRFNRSITAEFYPVKVESLTSKVAEPTEREIQDLYEKHKNSFAIPGSPTPGFKRLPKAKFQYLVGDFAKDFLEPEMAKITDEAALAYYEKNKEEFKKPQLPSAVPTEKPSGEKPETKPEGDAKPDSKSEDKPDGKPEPKSEEKSEPKTEPKDSKPEPKSESKSEGKTEDKPEPKSDDKPADKQGRIGGATEQFVNFEGDEPEKKEPEKKDPEKKADEPKADEPKKSDEPKSDEPKKADEPKKNDEATEKPSDDKEKPADEPKTEKPVEYRSFEDVKEEIRRSLALPKAQDQFNAAITAARKIVEAHGKAHLLWSVSQKSAERDKDKSRVKPRPELPVKEFPEKLTLKETTLVNFLELQKLDLGKVPGVIEEAYRREFTPYRPEQVGPPTGTQYLYWKVEEVGEEVPELKDVRNEVVAALKKAAALKPAKEAAEAKVKQARAANKSLKESLGEGVIVSGPFTFVARDFFRGGMRLGTIEGVEGVDYDFMSAVCGLGVGEVGTAVTHDQSIVYVVRVESEFPDRETLRERFAKTGGFIELHFGMQMERERLGQAWHKEFERRSNLTWHQAQTTPEASED